MLENLEIFYFSKTFYLYISNFYDTVYHKIHLKDNDIQMLHLHK